MLARIALVAVIAATGCTKRNPAFCDAETDCANGLTCNEMTSTCPIDCVVDVDCADPDAPICDRDTTCRACSASDECVAKDPMFPVCENGSCIGCVADADCTSPVAPVCETGTGACVGCSADAECLAKFAGERELCDMSSGTCVECLSESQADVECDAAEPICGDGLCRGCIAHSECAAQVCLDDGTCAAESAMVIVNKATGSIAGDCGTEGNPCNELRLGVLRALGRGLRVVRVDQGEHDQFVDLTTGIDVHIVVPTPGGASYVLAADPPSGTAGFLVSGGSTLIVDGLRITYDLNVARLFNGVECGANDLDNEIRVRRSVIEGWLDGVNAQGCGFVEITGSTIINQASRGVIVENTPAIITNNVISYNGTDAEGLGGIVIDQNAQISTELSFNTVVGNLVAVGTTAGIICTGDIAAHSNIVRGNDPGLPDRFQAQVNGGTCSHTFSAIEGAGAGGANMNIPDDPDFIDGDESRDGNQIATEFDLHLKPSSPCIDTADPSSTESVDLDGDPRPAGAANDIGADEAG